MIYGDPVHVLTDHEFVKNENHTGKLARWYLTIHEFSSVVYLQGKDTLAADALSRHEALVTPAYESLDKEEETK